MQSSIASAEAAREAGQCRVARTKEPCGVYFDQTWLISATLEHIQEQSESENGTIRSGCFSHAD
jgi:hypothetical protein